LNHAKFNEDLSVRDKLTKIDPEQFEREQRDLFDYGDIEKTSHHSGIRYGTLTKQLQPDNPTPSIATEFLAFLYGCRMTRPELEERVWALVSAYRRRMVGAKFEDGDLGEAIAACGEFVSVAVKSEDGMRTPEELEAARQSVLDSVERVTVYPASAHTGNLG
jgi:hypothetical protein